MAKTTCENCDHTYHWCWEEAFDKFGFGDGDGQIETWRVRAALEKAGYVVDELEWGLHNTIIYSIRKDGIQLIDVEVNVGYDDPRRYLPAEIVTLLDEAFPATCGPDNAGADS